MVLKKISLIITIFLIAIGLTHGENIQNSNNKFNINEIVDQIRDYSVKYNLNQNQLISVINYACSYYPERCSIYNGQLSDAFMLYAKTIIKSKANELNQAIQDNLNSNTNNDFFKISPESSQRLQKLFIQFSLLAGPTTSPENLQKAHENTDAQNIANNVNQQQIINQQQIAAAEKAKQEADAKAAAEKEAAHKLKHEQKLKRKQEEKEAADKLKLEQEQKAKQEQELKAKQEQEEKAKQEQEQKAKQEQELKAREAAELKAKQDQEAAAAAEKAKQSNNNNNNNNNNNIDYLGQFLDFMDFVTQSKNAQQNNNNNNIGNINNINQNTSPAIRS